MSYTLGSGAGFDERIKASVIVDTIAMQVWGRLVYNNSTQTLDSTHYSITGAQLATITTAFFEQDFRSGNVGGQFDNLLVADNVPEPGALALAAAAALLLALGLRRP